MPLEFWKWFDEKRRELDISDSAIARLAGVAQSVISRARTEEQPIGHEALAKIAPVLKTPISVAYRLAGYIESTGAPSPEHAEWNNLFELLSDADQEEMLAIARVKAKRGRSEKTKTR